MFIDTHTHLYWEQFDEDREKVIQRAIQSRISAALCIGTDTETSAQSLQLADKYAFVYAAVGLHPNDGLNAGDADLQEIEKMAAHPRCVAIGEIGLDYYRDYCPPEKQQQLFRSQLQLARKLNKPVIIHNRDAHEDVYNVLIDENAAEVGGVMHSFTGDEHFLDSVLAYNFYISFTGAITYKNANYENLIAKVPLEQLLLETDSPFLAPIPFRGKRNEPSYLRYSAAKIAEVKGISIEELAKITSANARKLFRLS